MDFGAEAAGESVGYQEARDTLKRWRSDGVRKSSQTVSLGKLLLKWPSSLGGEVWDVHEQLMLAALDVRDIPLAQNSLGALSKQFPGSLRVARLQGMFLEATGSYEGALDTYKDALEVYPTNAPIWKRKIAMFKSQGKILDALKELNKFLEVYMCDKEGWLELADIYVQVNNYSKAAFCLEELIVLNPHHHLYHQRYAEICYSQGTAEGMELAKKHYATALQLNPDNVRALYGFCWVCNVTASQKKSSEMKSRNARYIDWAKTQLKLKYQNDNGQMRIVEKMLDSLR